MIPALSSTCFGTLVRLERFFPIFPNIYIKIHIYSLLIRIFFRLTFVIIVFYVFQAFYYLQGKEIRNGDFGNKRSEHISQSIQKHSEVKYGARE